MSYRSKANVLHISKASQSFASGEMTANPRGSTGGLEGAKE